MSFVVDYRFVCVLLLVLRDRMWDLTVLVSDHCVLFLLTSSLCVCLTRVSLNGIVLLIFHGTDNDVVLHCLNDPNAVI